MEVELFGRPAILISRKVASGKTGKVGRGRLSLGGIEIFVRDSKDPSPTLSIATHIGSRLVLLQTLMLLVRYRSTYG